MILCETADMLYRRVLSNLLEHGKTVAPRGQKTIESIGNHYTLNQPRYNIVTYGERHLNYHFMLAEWLWMMMGMNDVDMIIPYNKSLLPFSDDAVTFAGAYGPKLIEQLPYVLDTLRRDRSSRQALLTIWRERPRPSADIPCTVSMQFIIRNEELHMVTYMRSNDVWLGLPYDLFSFTMIQQYVASKMGATLGQYHHMVGSLHLYEQHWDQASKLLNTGTDLHPQSVLPGNQLVGEIPSQFRGMYTAMTLMAKHAETADEMKNWVGMMNHLPKPWHDILTVLAHRFHQDASVLPKPWSGLIHNARDRSKEAHA